MVEAALVSTLDAAVEEVAVADQVADWGVCLAAASFADEDGQQRTDQAAWDRLVKLGLAAPVAEESPGAQPAVLT